MEERVTIWVEPQAVVVPNYNAVIFHPLGMLLGEECVLVDNGIKDQEDGAVMTTTKAAMLDLFGLLLGVSHKGVFSKSTDRNLNATNGMTFTACAAAAAKATVFQTVVAIVRAATGIKDQDWL